MARSHELRCDEVPANEHIFQGPQGDDSQQKLSRHASGVPPVPLYSNRILRTFGAGFESMTAAIQVCDSEAKEPDHVAGRFGSDALETLAHSTIGRRSPRRC
jgi:hypothetical protein